MWPREGVRASPQGVEVAAVGAERQLTEDEGTAHPSVSVRFCIRIHQASKKTRRRRVVQRRLAALAGGDGIGRSERGTR